MSKLITLLPNTKKQLVRAEAKQQISTTKPTFQPLEQATLFTARSEVLDVYMSDNLEDYLLQIVLATRSPSAYGQDLAGWLQYGASPRASIALDRCARAKAWLARRDYVTPDDIQELAFDVLRHRLILSYEAEAKGITPEYFIKQLLTRIAVP